MRRFEAFPFNDELDMLECHLTEVGDLFDAFILVEATVTFAENRPKPLHFADNADRFERWADKIVHVVADGLPEDESPWVRENAQRERVFDGLKALDAEPDDVLFLSDVDEIPTRLAAQWVNPKGFVVLHQRFHCFAVDWLHPQWWQGTVAARVRDIDSIARMRDARMFTPQAIPDAGWHFSWVSGNEEAKEKKMHEFSHPEIIPAFTGGGLLDCWAEGRHVDGHKLEPVEVSAGEWPRWITDGHAPTGWFRPREGD